MRSVLLCLLSLMLSSCSMDSMERTSMAPLDIVTVKKKQVIKNDTYVVQAGDTLYSIAWYQGTDVARIADYNQLSEPYRLVPGQKIYLTKKHTPQVQHRKKPYPVSKTSGYKKKEVASKRDIRLSSNVNKPVKNKTVSSWQWPAKGQLIGTFNTKDQMSKGIEISSKRGDKVVAAADGRVVYAGNALRGYGRLIIIKHNNHYLSAYAHNDRILVKSKQNIKKGQRIADMGSSGTDKVKLHFEIRYQGKSVDPLQYLPPQSI